MYIDIIGGYNDNIDIFNYINSKINKLTPKKQNNKKYAIFLFGPPASGKSHSLVLATNKIEEDINSFIQLNIDEFILETTEWEINKSTDLNNNKKLYNNIRNKIDKLFEILLQVCIMKNINFSFETTGIYFDWTLQIIKDIKKNNYDIILMYPYTNDQTLLVSRALIRANNNGRLIDNEDFNKNDYIRKALESFETKIIPNLNLFTIIYKYDANIPLTLTYLDNIKYIYFYYIDIN